jgi:penicillin-binding protein 2
MEIDDAVLTITERDAARIEWPLTRSVARFFFFGMLASFMVLGFRLVYLNVIKGQQYQEAAERNSLRQIVMPAPRGIIYDRFGKRLVTNVPSMDIVVTPADLPEDQGALDEEKRLIRTLLSINDDDMAAIFDKIDRHSIVPVPLKERVTQNEMLLFLSQSKELPGLSLYKTTHRNYADSLIFSHVLGYEGKIRKDELLSHPDYLLTDSIGKQGVEKGYEDTLRGTHGFRQVEVDALGQVQKELGTINPKPGNDIILNIDADLQKKVFDALQAILEKNGLERAAAIALDPRDGAVRALVSLPSFDNNLFAEGISAVDYQKLMTDPSQPLFDRAVSGEYPPGSTIKPVIAAAALAEGVITPSTIINGMGGVLRIGQASFHDWTTHGPSDVRAAIAESNDIFFYTVGGGYGNIAGLGMDRMKKYDNLFGYGDKTGIDLPSEADGFIPDTAWKKEKLGERWYVGDDYHASIGQGFVTATPLQIVNAVAAIANGGTLYVPHIVGQIRSADGKVSPIPVQVIRKDFIDSGILEVVREGMRQTVTSGTAQSLKTLSIETAGKTGTAQFGSDGKTHGWFVSFAPYEHPELALIVLVEGQGSEGYNTVPVAKEVYEWYFSRETNSEQEDEK